MLQFLQQNAEWICAIAIVIALDVALLNANYGIRKLHKVKKQKVNTYTWDEIKNE